MNDQCRLLARFSRAGGVTARLFPGVLLPGLPLEGAAACDRGCVKTHRLS